LNKLYSRPHFKSKKGIFQSKFPFRGQGLDPQ
jgi:hypothetical protein